MSLALRSHLFQFQIIVLRESNDIWSQFFTISQAFSYESLKLKSPHMLIVIFSKRVVHASSPWPRY